MYIYPVAYVNVLIKTMLFHNILLPDQNAVSYDYIICEVDNFLFPHVFVSAHKEDRIFHDSEK